MVFCVVSFAHGPKQQRCILIAKALIRDVIANTLSALHISRAVLQRKNRWVILTFHRVLPAVLRDIYPLPNLAVTPEELAWIIATLKPIFDIKTVSDAAQCLQSKDDFSPMLSITFDDGQWDNVEYALPVLRQQSVQATFYLPTDFIGTDKLLWHDQAAFAWRVLNNNNAIKQKLMVRLSQQGKAVLDCSSAAQFVRSLKRISPDQRLYIIDTLTDAGDSHVDWARMMTWQEASTLLTEGHEIGSHGKSHNLMPQQSAEQQQDELQGSKDAIQEHLGLSADSFCYPNGDYDHNTLELLTNTMYSNAVTTRWGINDRSTAKFQLLRCDMNPFLMTNRNGCLSRQRLLMRLAGFQRGDGR